jgi:hypothetical protein
LGTSNSRHETPANLSVVARTAIRLLDPDCRRAVEAYDQVDQSNVIPLQVDPDYSACKFTFRRYAFNFNALISAFEIGSQ